MKGTMHKPQANLRADQKFSPSRFPATRSSRKTTIGTSKPYTGAMRGTVHEPQVNIGADQKFSPIDVFNKKKGGTNSRISID